MKKSNWVSTLLYVIAGIFGVYTLYALGTGIAYVNEMITSQYLVVSDSMGDILNFFVTGTGTYLFYTCVLGGLGYLIQIAKKEDVVSIIEEVVVADNHLEEAEKTEGDVEAEEDVETEEASETEVTPDVVEVVEVIEVLEDPEEVTAELKEKAE